jgi:hypothetical protein
VQATALDYTCFRRNIIVGGIALVASLLIIYNWQCRGATPSGVARSAAYALVRGDTDWLWARASEQEKSIPGMSPELLREFQEEFLSAHLERAEVKGIDSIGASTWRAVVNLRVSVGIGGEVNLAVVGVVDDGRELVGVLESLVVLASQIEFADIEPDPIMKYRLGWQKYEKWFHDRGVTKWFDIQNWELREMPVSRMTTD